MPITLILRNPLDRDAREYISRAGVTDAATRVHLNEFVRSTKNLGLWSNMVCWPLRSAQNAGTGTTAYSLGGLGTYNGTLIGGPTWGSDGVNMKTTTQQRIETDLGPLSQPLSVFSVQAFDISDGLPSVAYDNVTNSGTNRTHMYHNASSTDIQIYASTGVVGGTFTDDVMFALQVKFNGASSSYSKNGASETTINPGTTAALKFRMGAPGLQKGPIMAFCAVLNGANVPSLYTLYKSTLGSGLGLP